MNQQRLQQAARQARSTQQGENIFRRLQTNKNTGSPAHPLADTAQKETGNTRQEKLKKTTQHKHKVPLSGNWCPRAYRELLTKYTGQLRERGSGQRNVFYVL